MHDTPQPRLGAEEEDTICNATRRWLERAVIGLNLCPFAKAVHVKQQIRYVVSTATDTDSLLDQLLAEMNLLTNTPAEAIDTTLLIHPYCLAEFTDYLDFLQVVDQIMPVSGMEGILQIASFHPQYCFENTPADDMANYTNRSPYPILHILREDSMSRAIDHYPDTEDITRRNIQTLREFGCKQWKVLFE